MSYQTALTIAEVVNDIHKKKYLLPAIQREFVWNPYQIERLFDSLMRDYPISSFLFWQVGKKKSKDYEFYEFLRDYHEKDNRHNPKASTTGKEKITAVLDGQQRLTSLYIALRGSYSYKLPRKRWNNEKAYPKRKLYLNLLQPSDETDFEYDFVFLTKEETQSPGEGELWFAVGDILNFKELSQVNNYFIQNDIYKKYTKEQSAFANKALSKLYSIIHVQPTVSYYLEKGKKLDKVLNIFIRINSGGTVLSYSDLLLSIATAQWETRDAREEITQFVDEINNQGEGFNFNKDFVLKTCLVLSDFADIAFKVDNFNKENMLAIEAKWDEITRAIRIAVGLVASFGYNRDTLTSNNALIPIAYYLMKNEARENFIHSSKNLVEKAIIKKWLILSLVKRIFSGQPDNVLRPLRKKIKENDLGGFPFEGIVNHFKGTNKTLIFSDEDIENLLHYKYGKGHTFSVLALLFPSLDFKNHFHIDHIFPKSHFSVRKLRKRGIAENDIQTFMDWFNYLGNLQLLEATPNIEKQNKDFDVWLNEIYPEKEKQAAYKERNYIPDVDLSFHNFIQFFEDREELLKTKFQQLLSVEQPVNQD